MNQAACEAFQPGDADTVRNSFRSHVMVTRDRVLDFLRQYNRHRTSLTLRAKR